MTLYLRLMRLLMIFSPIRFYFMSFQSTCEAAAQRRQPTVVRVVVQSFKFRAPLLISRNLVNLSIAPKSTSSVHAFSLTTPAKIPSIIHLPFIETSRTLAILTIPGNNKHLLVGALICQRNKFIQSNQGEHFKCCPCARQMECLTIIIIR